MDLVAAASAQQDASRKAAQAEAARHKAADKRAAQQLAAAPEVQVRLPGTHIQLVTNV
jgi:hypothetical protein